MSFIASKVSLNQNFKNSWYRIQYYTDFKLFFLFFPLDMYGQGRYPFYLEPAVILVISDGGKLTTQGSVQSELNLPMHSSVPGSELTREPFRWDQRLYALVLRMAGTPPLSQETGHVACDSR